MQRSKITRHPDMLIGSVLESVLDVDKTLRIARPCMQTQPNTKSFGQPGLAYRSDDRQTWRQVGGTVYIPTYICYRLRNNMTGEHP